MARKINGKEVAADVQRGMSDIDLMTKYDLSPGQLTTLIEKLKSAGLLQSGFKCPSCGYPQPERFNECPQCGVLVSKLQKDPILEKESEMAPDDSEVSRPSFLSRISEYKTWIVAASVLVVVSGSIYFAFNYMRTKQTARVEAEKQKVIAEQAKITAEANASMEEIQRESRQFALRCKRDQQDAARAQETLRRKCMRATTKDEIDQCRLLAEGMRLHWEKISEQHQREGQEIQNRLNQKSAELMSKAKDASSPSFSFYNTTSK